MKENKSSMNTKDIAYWVVTGLLAIMLLVSGIGALTKQDFLIQAMTNIHFPLYVMNILGMAYTMATIAILVPVFPLVKEWAYAGLVFAMYGALSSHLSIGDTFENTAGSVVLMTLIIASYLLRPASRRLARPVLDKAS